MQSLEQLPQFDLCRHLKYQIKVNKTGPQTDGREHPVTTIPHCEFQTPEEKNAAVGQDGKKPGLNIEYPEPNPAIVDLAESCDPSVVKRRPGRPKVYGGPKKRQDSDYEEEEEEEEMTLELDESSNEGDVEEMEVAATEEDETGILVEDMKLNSCSRLLTLDLV